MYKLRLVFAFFRKTTVLLLTHRKIWWSDTPSLKLLLKSMKFTILESLSIIKYKQQYWNTLSEKRERELLSTFIKKRAHHLEKIMFYPDEHTDKDKNELVFNHLKEALATWKDQDYEVTSPIRWARTLLAEYEEYGKCPRLCADFKGETTDTRTSRMEPRELLKLLKARRSRRFFSTAPLAEEAKELLAEAALSAPSSCNRQAVHLIFVEDSDLKNFTAGTVPGGRAFFHFAPCIIVVTVDKRDYRYPAGRSTPFQDAAAAIQNILLLAETMGLACCWGSCTSYGDIFHEAELRDRLSIPEHHLIAGAVAVGQKAQDVCIVPRDNPKTGYSIDTFYQGK